MNWQETQEKINRTYWRERITDAFCTTMLTTTVVALVAHLWLWGLDGFKVNRSLDDKIARAMLHP